MMGVDIFLMGTAGDSTWREPFKTAYDRQGITYFDPIIKDREWKPEDGKIEAQALVTAKIIAMAITTDTAGIASLAESGWTVVSAILRKQSVGIYIDPEYSGEMIMQATGTVRLDTLKGTNETVDDASRRARKLVLSHAKNIDQQFEGIDLFIANNLDELKEWTINKAKVIKERRRKWPFSF